MAEEQQENKKEEATASTPHGRRKVLILAGIGALIVGLGAPLGYFLFTSPEEKVEEVSIEKLEDDTAALEGSAESLELEEGEEPLGAIVPFDTFLVNLAGGKYIRVQMQIEFETPDIPKKLYSRLVPIRDAIITLLTRQSAEDLDGADGKEKLKRAVRDLINQQLRREDVRRVYFTQFVIQ